jgi:hypothetical protein
MLKYIYTLLNTLKPLVIKSYLKSLSNERIEPALLLKYPREMCYNLVLKSKGKRRGTIKGPILRRGANYYIT